MRPRTVVQLLLTVSLAGCQAAMYGTAGQLESIHVGQSRDEVVAVLGEPEQTLIHQDDEVLKYYWMPAVIAWTPRYYFVLLRSARVTTFGEWRDFEAAWHARVLSDEARGK